MTTEYVQQDGHRYERKKDENGNVVSMACRDETPDPADNRRAQLMAVNPITATPSQLAQMLQYIISRLR